jgi:acyl-CoA reductase-like NAD-dependent aldehyde dehydrogenase
MENHRTPLINPASGEMIGFVRQDDPNVLPETVAKARAAQKIWEKQSFRDRRRSVFAIRDFIAEHADRITAVISRSTGKTRVDALSTEVIPAAMGADYYARKAESFLKKKRIMPGSLLFANKVSYLERIPWGVIGIISPWNYPFGIPFHEVTMALMAGNAVILKVATQTQDVGDVIRETVSAGGLPEGLFHLVNLPGGITGGAFIDAGIDKLFFTGSGAVGKELMAKASGRLLPLSLELGGNDAMIVCHDAHLERAASGAVWAGFSNCGQSCGGVERIFVEKEVYDSFTELLREKTKVLRQGEDKDFEIDFGSLINAKHLQEIKAFVKDALDKGARATARSREVADPKEGFYHPAVVLEDVTGAMAVMREEVFGPILAVMKVKDIEEAVAWANDSRLGLTASVWTRDRRKARDIAARLQAGVITINDHLMSHGLPETPWGGFKESGIGRRTHGRLGLEEMTQPRVVIDDILPGVQRDMWWYPHGKDIYEGLKGALNFLYSRDTTSRLKGMAAMIKLFMRTFRR